MSRHHLAGPSTCWILRDVLSRIPSASAVVKRILTVVVLHVFFDAFSSVFYILIFCHTSEVRLRALVRGFIHSLPYAVFI